METTHLSQNDALISKSYWQMLEHLHDDIKIDLIMKLMSSLHIQKSNKSVNGWTSAFAGKWIDERSANDIIKDIKHDRTTNGEIEL